MCIRDSQSTECVYFKSFGDPRVISRSTGRVFSDIAALKAAKPDDGPATELLHFAIHSPRSPYGVPRWVGTLLCVLGSRQMEEVNFLYFENKSVPPMALLLSLIHIWCSTPLGRRGIFWEIANEELRKYPHHTRQHVPWWLCRFFTTDVKAASQLALDLPTEERVERFGRPTLIEQFDSLPIEDFQQEFEGKFVDETYSFFPYEPVSYTHLGTGSRRGSCRCRSGRWRAARRAACRVGAGARPPARRTASPRSSSACAR